MSTAIVQLIHHIVRPLKARMNSMIARAVLDAADDTKMFQSVEVTVGPEEKLPGVEHLQPGGVTHVPLRGAEGLLLCVQGLRGHPVMVLLSNRDARPKGLQPGETALWTAGPLGGVRVLCKGDGAVLIGSDEAAQAMILGTAHVAALGALKDAILTYATAIQVIADPASAALDTLTTALGLFATHLDEGALSAKHKLDE